MLDLKYRPPNLVVGEDRFKAMDEQGIDMEAISINAFWYKPERDVAEKLIKLQNEKLAELVAAHPDRFVAFATVAMQHPDLAVAAARIRHQETRAARHVGRRQRRRHGVVRPEVSSDLGQGRGTRLPRLHASGRHQGAGAAAQGQRRPRKHHRQSARDDARAVASDLRGHARSFPRPEALRRARRRLSAVLCAALGRHLRHVPGPLRRRAS